MSHRHRKPNDEMSRAEGISRGLSRLLRHEAPKENVKIYPGGFVDLHDVIEYLRMKKKLVVTEDEIKEQVEKNDKQRFSLQTIESGKLQIRANQGHSFEIEEAELTLTPITDPSQFPIVVHGTYTKYLKSIKAQGLSRMTRTHIHFAPGVLGDSEVLSGMRKSAQIYIYVDLEKAMKDGLKFFVSKNNVILCSGNDKGYLDPQYFSKVVNVKTGEEMTT